MKGAVNHKQRQHGARPFLIDSDNAIHLELSLRSHQLACHPFMKALAKGAYKPPVVAWACRRRLINSGRVLPLLERAKAMAETADRHELATALKDNILDENGLDRETGMPTGLGTHHEWCQWFLAALDEVDPPEKHNCQHAQLGFPSWDTYPLEHDDSLAVIVGMLMIAEKNIPIEFNSFLSALSSAFPALVDHNRPKALLYFVDHIKHDEQRHLPDLIDGFLCRIPGSKDYKVQAGQIQDEASDLIKGMERVLKARHQFYDQLSAIAGIPS